MITDLHKNNDTKPGRFNYPAEIDYVDTKIIEIREKYKKQGYRVNAIFLGDIFDKSYRSVEKSLEEFSSFQKLLVGFSRCYSLVGNHELTYYKNNPFWYCMRDVSSPRARKAKGLNWKAKGNLNLIQLPDILEDGNVEFLFNHYGCSKLNPRREKVSIGLFHQDVYFREVINDVKLRDENFYLLANEEILKRPNYQLLDRGGALGFYDYCFFGHAHMMYGTWKDDDIVFQYLASLGRSNVKEVLDNFLVRDIPAVIVENDKFKCVEHNEFNLMSRRECVDEDVVESNHEKYLKQKEVNQILSLTSSEIDDPMSNLKSRINNDEYLIGYIDNILGNDYDNYLIDFNERFNTIRRELHDKQSTIGQ